MSKKRKKKQKPVEEDVTLFDKFLGTAVVVPEPELDLTIEDQETLITEAPMSNEEERCYEMPNLCNDSNYLFGRNECVDHAGIPLRTAGGTKLGYAVNKGKAKHIKIVWKGLAKEQLIIQKNGQDVECIVLDGTDESPKCVKIKENFCDCDVLNVIETPMGVRDGEEVGEFHPACSISVVIEYEQECDRRFKPEQDGLAELVDASDSTDIVDPEVWYVKNLDVERTNSLPSFISPVFGENAYELRHGLYKLNYGAGIEFDKSVSVEYTIKLQINVDGAGWVDYPYSTAVDSILFGGGSSNVQANRTVTMEIPRGSATKVRIIEKISDDSYIVASGAGGFIVVERVDQGIKL